MSIQNQVAEDDKFWSEAIYNICKGDAANMRELRKMDIFDFFNYLENYKDAGSRTGHKGGR